MEIEIAFIAVGGVVLGALISSGFAYFTTRLQLNKAKELDLDRRLFDARREAYERAVTVFSFTHNERLNGRRYPSASTDTEAQWKTHEMMGPVMLWSDKDLVLKIFEVSAYFNGFIPADVDGKLLDEKKGNRLWNELIILMRKEVGMKSFMPNSVAELPKTPTS